MLQSRFSAPALTASVGAISLACAVPLAANAQLSGTYTPPKVLTRGTNTAQAAGAGLVTVKVLVKGNGSIGSVSILKSTNPGDNAAALEVARTSKYAPGKHGGKPDPVTFYTYVLSFSGAGTSADALDTNAQNDTFNRANADLRAGKYDAAKGVLAQYLHAAPGDEHANLLLGVADYYENDLGGAALAFDKAGTIPANFRSLAVQAYYKYGSAQLAAKNYPDAIAYAAKDIAMNGAADGYNLRGTAELESHQYDAAIADLEKARSLATAASPHSQAIVLANLGMAYAASGQTDKAIETSKQVKALDPSVDNVDDAIAQVVVGKANAASTQGDYAGAARMLDTAAPAVGKQALPFYDAAAMDELKVPKPDWKAIKAEADKALAIDGNDVQANYLAGYALSQQNDFKGANPYFVRAQTAVKNGAKVSDPTLPGKIDEAVKQTASGK
jgi:tetratricopeptide (TPR) repeat protein